MIADAQNYINIKSKLKLEVEVVIKVLISHIKLKFIMFQIMQCKNTSVVLLQFVFWPQNGHC